MKLCDFLKRVNITGECHWWMGAVDSGGYGSLRRDGKTLRAHRVAYTLSNGEIPEGQCVLHTCDNRLCVNPEHLFLGTHLDNIRDMNEKRRQIHGDSHPMRKINSEQARAIKADPRKQRQIAADYGISPSHVSGIKSGKYWQYEI